MNDITKKISAFKAIEVREKKPLIRKVIIFTSPVDNNIEHRVAYFQSYNEANLWEETAKKLYDSMKVKYTVYTNLVRLTQDE